ncbi:MAG: hypothetical protein O2955_11310 [Planctomycetota bacterium]|nr:hypothetical protein [Planctomycetota bacterium]MDA1213101.1 hypothetical protein [Planctomycetota bacterium]
MPFKTTHTNAECPKEDRITTLGSGVDNAVLRIGTTYEVRGMRETITSYNNAAVGSGDIVNQCQFVYNSFGQLTTEYQSHSGAVNTMSTPKVQYGYANGSANIVRPTSLTYPDGRVLTFDYGTTDGIDDASSRIFALVDDDMGSTHLAEYSYLGRNTFVKVDYTEPDLEYVLFDLAGSNDPDTGDIYSGFDRFGRVKDSRWYDYGSSTDADRIKYGYDRNSNRICRQNTVAEALGKHFDELYAYDLINRLKDLDRGTLNGGKDGVTDLSFAECWALDQTGNWKNYRQDDDGSGTWDLSQNRATNMVNEITDVSESAGPSWVTPVYNRAGNMTTMPQPANPTASYAATYDAWNRLVKIAPTGAATLAEYAYDGARRRVIQKSYVSGMLDETRHLYYTEPSMWQVIEERVDSESTADKQFVWGLRYVDDIVLRDDTSQRLYGMQDANWNVTSIANDSGDVQERFAYSAYGVPVFMNSSFVVLSSSAADWETLYCGYRYETVTALYNIRHRVMHNSLGTWIQRDFLPHEISLYEYAFSNPIHLTDWNGLIASPPSGRPPRDRCQIQYDACLSLGAYSLATCIAGATLWGVQCALHVAHICYWACIIPSSPTCAACILAFGLSCLYEVASLSIGCALVHRAWLEHCEDQLNECREEEGITRCPVPPILIA